MFFFLYKSILAYRRESLVKFFVPDISRTKISTGNIGPIEYGDLRKASNDWCGRCGMFADWMNERRLCHRAERESGGKWRPLELSFFVIDH
jgi:hypothetical protein